MRVVSLCSRLNIDKFCVALRNGHRSGRAYVNVAYSDLVIVLLEFLFHEGFISSFQFISFQQLRVSLVYRNGVGLLSKIYSGLRIKPFSSRLYSFRYISFLDIRNLHRKGIFGIVLTSKGLKTYEEIAGVNKGNSIGGLSIVQIFY